MDLGPRGEGPEDGNGDFTGRTSGRVIKGHPVFQGGENVMMDTSMIKHRREKEFVERAIISERKDAKSLNQKLIEFREATSRLIESKVTLRMVYLPTYIVHENGEFETILPAKMLEQEAMIDERINMIFESIFIDSESEQIRAAMKGEK